MQRAQRLPARPSGVGGARLEKCPVGDYLHYGIELWVNAFDAPQVRLNDLYGRQLAVTNCARQAGGGCGRHRGLALNRRAHVMRLPHI
jgi:hypothetical protein